MHPRHTCCVHSFVTVDSHWLGLDGSGFRVWECHKLLQGGCGNQLDWGNLCYYLILGHVNVIISFQVMSTWSTTLNHTLHTSKGWPTCGPHVAHMCFVVQLSPRAWTNNTLETCIASCCEIPSAYWHLGIACLGWGPLPKGCTQGTLVVCIPL